MVTCSGEDKSNEGVVEATKSVYQFSKEQYVTKYELTTTNSFSDEETFNTYYDKSLETVSSNTDNNTIYTLEKGSDNLSFSFSYKVSIKKGDLEKDYYKASKVIKRAEENGLKCVVDGIKSIK